MLRDMFERLITLAGLKRPKGRSNAAVEPGATPMFLHMLGIAIHTIAAGMSADELAQAANAFTMAFVLARVVNFSGAAAYPDLLNFDDWSDDDDVPVVLPSE